MKFTDILKQGKDKLTENLASTKGGFKLKKSSIDDQNIKDTIALYAKAKGLSVQDATEQFKLRLEEQKKGLGTVRMNKNAVENAAESVAFGLISELDPEELDLSSYGIDDPEDLLDRDYFFDLTQYVLGENAQFFPLRNPFERQAVRPFFFITPDHLPLMKDERLKQSAQHHCKTAFCTPNAEMVFSRKFTEQLAISALLNKVKPKSKKYKSNGGPIPDHYAYLEFVMLHELLHFSAGDHFYTEPMVKKISKKYPKMAGRAHTILNYVGDYINNWQLAKSGYEQLPIGLFSDEINYDKFESYEDIIDAVIKDIEDMSDQEFDDMKKEMDKSMDDHMDNEEDQPSQGGQDSTPDTKETPEQKSPESGDQSGDQGDDTQEPEDSDADTQDGPAGGGEPSDNTEEVPDNQSGSSGINSDSEDGEETDSDSSDSSDSGQAGQAGDGDSQGPSDQGQEPDDISQRAGDPQDDHADRISKAIDDAMKRNNEKVDTRDDGNNDAQGALDSKDDDATDADIKKKVGQAGAKIDFKKVATVVNWKKILKKMIPSGTGDVEDTYSRMSRQATSSMVTAMQTGAGRISPGEILMDSDKKGLVFVIDNSGSVMSKVNEFNQEIMQLLKKNKKSLDNMYIIKFSDGFDLHKIDVKKMKATKVMNPEAVAQKKPKFRFGEEKSVNSLFGRGFGYGTYYTQEMHKVVDFLHKNNMNIIMFTDDDLVRDDRTKKFFNLGIKRKNSIAMFITDDMSYRNMKNKFGSYKWMTVLK